MGNTRIATAGLARNPVSICDPRRAPPRIPPPLYKYSIFQAIVQTKVHPIMNINVNLLHMMLLLNYHFKPKMYINFKKLMIKSKLIIYYLCASGK